MRLVHLSFAIIALTMSAQHVQAQELSAQQRGRNLARQVCSECHAIGPGEILSPNWNAPTFVAIASTPGMTEAALNFILHNSHRRMPNIILTPGQSNAIIAYVQSLKK
jgi:mono/diheme cytochrome c family protein